MKLSNNTILITGGSNGLGFELAKQLIAKNNTVIITGRDKARLDSAAKKLPGLHTMQSDVSSPEEIKRFYEDVTAKFPQLNIIVNNAGEMRAISLNDESTDLVDLTREIDINLMVPIRMVQQFLPHLKTKGNTAIINVTSGLAMLPYPVSPIYGATKAGMHSYTQSLRVQLQNTGIKVFELLAPGANTDLKNAFTKLEGFDEKQLMEPDKVIAAAIKGIENDDEEIYPGIAKMLKVMSRLAPKFLLKQTAKVGKRFMETGIE